MPVKRAARFVVAGLLLIATAGDRRFDLPAQTTLTVIIDGNQQFQTIDGFGVNANVNSWNDGELAPAIDLLVDQLGATLWRVVIDNADWEATNDDADDHHFNWTFYEDVYTTPKFEELWSTISYLNQRQISQGLVLNFMGPVPSWMGGSQINFAAEDEWVEMIASLVYYARVTRGLQFALLSPMNEPDHDGIEGPRVDQSQYVRLMRKLAQRLDEIGLADIRLIGPDNASIFGGVGGYMPEMMTDSLLMSKVDHFAFHNYAGDSGGAAAAIESSPYPTRNFWITEVTNIWDILAHLDQGPSALLVWDAYDSVYNHAILAGRGTEPPNDEGNGPPLLAYDTGTGVYTPRRGFYECAQLFRFVSPGSRRIGVSVFGSSLTIFAFRDDARGRLTIVGRNASPDDQTLDAALEGLPAIDALELYQTTPSANLQRRPNVPVSSGSFSVRIPGNSTFTLTTSTGSDAEPPTVSITEPTDGAMISGTVAVLASASDNVGVAGVRFVLDGIAGLEDSVAPYSLQWDSTTATDGPHTLTARARDTAGNVTTSAPITVIVSNRVDTTPPTVIATVPANGDDSVGVTTLVAATFSEPIDPATITTTTVTLHDRDTAVNASVSYAAGTVTLTPPQALSPGMTYTATIKGGTTGVRDLSGNPLSGDASWSFTTTIGDGCPCSIWSLSTPSGPPIDDPNAVELGLKFRADRNGTVVALRYYKHSQNTGVHVGSLWTSGGTLLRTVTFTAETDSGWQEAALTPPVNIQANTNYVVSYHTTTGYYAATTGGLASGVDNGPLHAVPDAPGDGNGVYRYGTASVFPDQTYQATNYWIDVVFHTDIGIDTVPPAVTITAPSDGATISGTATVTATASDNVGVTGVQFLLDGAPLGSEDVSSPYVVAWDTHVTGEGPHVISARARDRSGNETAATDVRVNVRNDTSAPVITLTTPTNGEMVSGDAVSIAATSTDDVGVAGVQFLVDGAPLHAEDTTDPYMVSWNTTGTTNGVHQVSAIARDAAGNRTTASPITVTVVNEPPLDLSPPTIAITHPLVDADVSGIVTLSADASDNVGVVGVQFLLDGMPLGSEDLTSPYSVAWTTVGIANGAHSISAWARDAAGNRSTAAAIAVSVSNAAPSSGLVAAYGFEEGSGTTTADASGHGHSGTLSGAAWTPAGRFGGALSFDGVDDLVTLTNSNALDLTSGMTLEAWVRPATVTNWRTVVLKEASSGLSYALYSSNDVSRPDAYVRTSMDIGLASPLPLPTDTWSHLAATFDGRILRLYVNGIEVATRSELGPIVPSSNPVRVGGNLFWGEYFQGDIDEVRIYNRALSLEEIQAAIRTPVAGGF